MRIGPKYIRWKQLIYFSPTARLLMNNSLLSPFLLVRGARQGCLLSLLPNTQAIEPFTTAARQNLYTTGIIRHAREEKNNYIC